MKNTKTTIRTKADNLTEKIALLQEIQRTLEHLESIREGIEHWASKDDDGNPIYDEFELSRLKALSTIADYLEKMA